ncbi:unnamed protein product [Vitrella brassicaformis CCMP3155]|uniref:Uncharacterized protein n=1 Tax=Vitrella brassicaformis (strain CCMP3155) TaxID=1169540 RepID=A0A0G4ETV1_VITBC|nr:unnamed protein product [Vitrella brassicaformis CCMP3155]|eukprot:CEM01752.1 unnamed protein product [Vitrella brassicaformis CCMP3155]
MVSRFYVDLGMLPFQEAAYVRPHPSPHTATAALEGNAAASGWRCFTTPELLPVPPSLVPSPCQSPSLVIRLPPPLHPRASSTPSLHSQTGTPVTPLGQVQRQLGELSPLTLPRRGLSPASSISSKAGGWATRMLLEHRATPKWQFLPPGERVGGLKLTADAEDEEIDADASKAAGAGAAVTTTRKANSNAFDVKDVAGVVLDKWLKVELRHQLHPGTMPVPTNAIIVRTGYRLEHRATPKWQFLPPGERVGGLKLTADAEDEEIDADASKAAGAGAAVTTTRKANSNAFDVKDVAGEPKHGTPHHTHMDRWLYGCLIVVAVVCAAPHIPTGQQTTLPAAAEPTHRYHTRSKKRKVS